MSIERELRILRVDPHKTARVLKKHGARFIGTHYMKRFIFAPIQPNNSWVRLRTDGKNHTLAFKQIFSDTAIDTTEYEIEVSDFKVAHKLLVSSGLRQKSYQENQKIEYQLKNAIISIEVWPKIAPFVEIEAKSAVEIYAAASQLGFNKGELVAIGPMGIYKNEGIDLDTIKELTLSDNELINTKYMI